MATATSTAGSNASPMSGLADDPQDRSGRNRRTSFRSLRRFPQDIVPVRGRPPAGHRSGRSWLPPSRRAREAALDEENCAGRRCAGADKARARRQSLGRTSRFAPGDDRSLSDPGEGSPPPILPRQQCCLGPISDVQLREQDGYMVCNRLCADAKPFSNCCIAQTVGQAVENLAFPFSERRAREAAGLGCRHGAGQEIRLQPGHQRWLPRGRRPERPARSRLSTLPSPCTPGRQLGQRPTACPAPRAWST